MKSFDFRSHKVTMRAVVLVVIALAGIAILAVRVSLLAGALDSQGKWSIPAYGELIDVKGRFVSDLSRPTREPYIFKTDNGRNLALQCYPRGTIYRSYDANDCLSSLSLYNTRLEASVTLKYFQVEYEGFKGDPELVVGEVESQGVILRSFGDSSRLIQIHKNVQIRESSGNKPFFIGLAIFLGIVMSAIVLKEYRTP